MEGEPIQPLALSLAVLELMRSASSNRPLAIGIDDAQWLDESSTGIVRFALRRLESEPVIVIVAERTHATTETPAVIADLPADRVARLPVKALGPEEIDRLLDESLNLQLSPTMLKRVHRMSGGNPFHAVEIGRALESGGVDHATQRVSLPDSLGGLLRARLESLPSDAREVTAHVAALSHPTAALLEATLGQDRAGTGLAEARDAAVLAPGDDPIRFTHPLLASEVYGALDDADRADLHRRLAGVVSEPEEHARHLALGANGSDPDGRRSAGCRGRSRSRSGRTRCGCGAERAGRRPHAGSRSRSGTSDGGVRAVSAPCRRRRTRARAARASPGGTRRHVGLRSGRAALSSRRGPDAHGRLQRVRGACPRGPARGGR